MSTSRSTGAPARRRLTALILAGLALGLAGGLVPGTAARATTGIISGGSITYVKDNDIWVTSPDGARRARITFDGSQPSPDDTGDSRYGYPSRSDAGDVVVAARNEGTRGWVWVMDRRGRVLTKFEHRQSSQSQLCSSSNPNAVDWFPRGLQHVEVSPDGTKIASTVWWEVWQYQPAFGACLSSPVTETAVTDFDGRNVGNSVRVQSADPSRALNPGWPSWAGSSRLVIGEQHGTEIWYADAPTWQAHLWVANVTDRAGRDPALRANKLVSRSQPAGGASRLRLWSANGGPPALPTARCDLAVQVGGSNGFFYSPSWAPDGNALVWYEGDGTNDEPGEGLQVMAVADPATTSCPGGYVRRTLVEGGLFPHWGPAPVPTTKAPADFDGDGDTDVSVFRPSSGTWFVRGGLTAAWGTTGDIATPADYDGDGRTDVAVFRPSLGVWFLKASSAGESALGWGTQGDLPVPADYDGDGKADVAVFRPSAGVWFLRPSGGGAASAVAWGTQGDIPVPGDYDGDGDADVAVFRPSAGVWFVHPGGGGTGYTVGWGTQGDIPVPGDYDGDGDTDVAVFRPSVGVWFVHPSSAAGWGTQGDVPLPLPAAIHGSF